MSGQSTAPSVDARERRGGRRRQTIEMAFDGAYPYARVFAAPEDPAIAFEPMTAPASAPIAAGPELTMLALGDACRATCSIGAR